MTNEIFSEEQIEKIKEIVIEVLKEQINISGPYGTPIFKFEKKD